MPEAVAACARPSPRHGPIQFRAAFDALVDARRALPAATAVPLSRVISRRCRASILLDRALSPIGERRACSACLPAASPRAHDGLRRYLNGWRLSAAVARSARNRHCSRPPLRRLAYRAPAARASGHDRRRRTSRFVGVASDGRRERRVSARRGQPALVRAARTQHRGDPTSPRPRAAVRSGG